MLALVPIVSQVLTSPQISQVTFQPAPPPQDQNIRFTDRAEFKSGSPMRFEGEAEILCDTIFHDSVTFITDKVRIYGEATYHGLNDTSVLSAVPFDHLTPDDFLDWNVKVNTSRLIHFTKADGIAKFVAGENVVFHGPVIFKKAVTLVRPIFHGDVRFAAQPEVRALGVQ